MNLQELLATAQAWHDQDPDAETRAELAALIANQDEAELRSRFEGRLAFGTAGLRGELGAGSNRMNRVLVAQAALGLARYLLKNADPGQTPSVAIGFDGRTNSDIFAKDSAEIMAGAGIAVHLFDEMCPTPLVAFAVKRLNLSAGVMVTASHNPPRDNGYKVYLGGANGGGQIVSPADSEIAAEIDLVAATLTFDQMPKSSQHSSLGNEIRQNYIDQASGLIERFEPSELKIVYTAMHGVGWATVEPLFAGAGLPKPIVVAEQIKPDAAFPTVAFPNPEEPGALDLAFATAESHDADLVLANDPDADRLAIGIKTGNGWQRLTGDQLGLILGDWAASQAKAKSIEGALACSIVSGSALSEVAKQNGLRFVETLTGFKWITKVDALIFGYEEALGYSVDPGHTPDKDGITAALVVAKIAVDLAKQDKTMSQHLSELADRYGHFATGQISIRVTDLSVIASTMKRLRKNPPTQIAGYAAKLTDLSVATAELPATDGLRFDVGDDLRVIIRPSGTEPKLKCYLQAKGVSEPEATSRLQALDRAMRELLA